MRPIKLIMSAFGPYKDVEVVDFNELGSRNLFLITGPTGSGKTTIFDAISFAIYGEASGGMRTAESLRSQFSDDGVLTEVELEFELRGIKYHIHRIPKQNRLKASGIGFTEQKPDATLTIYDAEPRTIVTGVRNVNTKMESVIGINSEQFKQIMMIPQGEFQKLLTSNSEERQKVLQQLFDTSIYNTIQTKLDMQAKSLYGEIKKRKEIRDHEISKIECPIQEELMGLIQAEDRLVPRIIELTRQQVKSDEGKIIELDREIKKLGKRIEKTIEDKQKAKENNHKLELKDATRHLLAEKGLLSEEMDQLNQKAKRGERAQVIVAMEDNYHLRASESDNKKKDLEKVVKEKIQIEIKAKETETLYLKESSTEMKQEREGYVEELSRLRAYTEKVESIDAVSKSITHLNNSRREIEKEQIANNEFIESSNKALEVLRTKSTQALEASVKVGEVNNALIRVKDIEKKLNNLVNLKASLNEESEMLTAQKQLLKTLDEKMKTNTVNFKRSNLDFLMNQAAVLAKDLNEGDLCPVCGSTQHPKLAVFSEKAISKEGLDKLEKIVKDSEASFNKKKNAVDVLVEKLNTLSKNYDDLTVELSHVMDISISAHQIVDFSSLAVENDSKQSQLALEKAELEKQAGTYERIQEEIKKLSEEIHNAEKAKNDLMNRLIKSSSDLTKLQSDLNNIYSDVPEEVRTSIKLAQAIKVKEELQAKANRRLDQARKDYETAKEKLVDLMASERQLVKELKGSEERLEMAKITLDVKISESEFKDMEDYINAKLSKEVINEYKARLEQYSKEMHALKQQVEQLTLQTKGVQIVDLSTYDEMIDNLRLESSNLSNEKGLTSNRVNNNSNIITEVEKINSEIGDQESIYEVVGNLSSIAKGNNQSRVTFERYVLAAFLEDIIAAANIRLTQMTGGRYTLSRTEELQRKNAKGGLELEVLDGFTGKSRHVKTLSGGEGFKASLSMALGLADVVQSYAGGVQLDTMFIDEGFGTLDQESLDSAISCLIELQKTGRLVGIISHVQELKERIDTRLEVSSSSVGSETRFIVG